MSKDIRIIKPSTPFGMNEFLKEIQQAILEGYRFPEDYGQAHVWYGDFHAITLYKEEPKDVFEVLSDHKLKSEDLIKIAKDVFGLDVPENLKRPTQIKKFIKDNFKQEGLLDNPEG